MPGIYAPMDTWINTGGMVWERIGDWGGKVVWERIGDFGRLYTPGFSLSLLIIMEFNLLGKVLCESFYPKAYYMSNSLSPILSCSSLIEQIFTLRTPLTYRVYH